MADTVPEFDYRKHIEELYRSVPHQFEFHARSRDEFKAWQLSFRPRLREALGLTNMEADLQDHRPKAKRADTAELRDYIRESGIFG